jgi:hypothetical protein
MTKLDTMATQTYKIGVEGVEGSYGIDIMTIGGGGGSYDDCLMDVNPIDLGWDDNEIRVEKVNHPSHYNQGSIECIDAIESATKGLSGVDSFCTGNSIKYMWRWKQKGGLDDLKKAKWYIERLITRWENHEIID